MEPRSIAVYRAGALGDLIVMFPVLTVLRERWPDARITLVAPGEPAALALASDLVDRTLSNESPAVAAWHAGDGTRLREALGYPDVFVAYASDHDGELEASVRRAGFPKYVMFAPLPPAESRVHATDHALVALRSLGIVRSGDAPTLSAPETSLDSARTTLSEAGIQQDQRYAVIHTGSSSRARNWPDLPLLASEIAESISPRVVLQRGPVEAERGIGDGWAIDCPVVGPLSVETLAGLIAGAALYIGNDTGPSHLAAALGVPTITVFGRDDAGETTAAMWAPRGPRALAVEPEQGKRWPAVDRVLALAHGFLEAPDR